MAAAAMGRRIIIIGGGIVAVGNSGGKVTALSFKIKVET